MSVRNSGMQEKEALQDYDHIILHTFDQHQDKIQILNGF